MPLTQLSTLVLPAPFGPIRANSSPASTASDTPSSTTSPPKRSVRRSMASSAIPSPAAAILLDVAVAPPLAALPAALAAEIEFLDVGMAAQALRRSVEHDAAVLHHVAVVGDLQRHGRALLHDQDGDAELAADLGQPPQQILHHDRRQAERKLVHQQQLRPADQRAGQRQHLPLAAGEQPTDAALELAEPGKKLVDQGLPSTPLRGAGAVWHRRGEVLGHRAVGTSGGAGR